MKSITNGNALAEKIYKQLKTLPDDSLVQVAGYVEYLRFQARKTVRKPTPRRVSKPQTKPDKPLTIVRLGGILKGYNFSPEKIKEARREMWKKFADIDK